MLPFLAALVVLGATPGTPCALHRPQNCSETYELGYDPAFFPAVAAFLGKGRVDYLYSGRLVDQQYDVLHGPPDEPVRIGDPYRFTACREHSCDEKGALVLETDGRIVATAILHTACGTRSREDCINGSILTVFARDPAHAKPVTDNLVAWAKSKVDGRGSRLVAVEVYFAGNGVSTPVSRETLAPE